MKKYLEIAKILFKAQLEWRFDVFMSMLFTVVKILFAVIVWGAIFGKRDTVSGFSYASMLTYYAFSSFISQIDLSDGVGGEIAARVRDGSFTKFMVIPVRMQGYWLAQTFGAAALYIIANLVATALWVFVFRIPLTFGASPAVAVCAALMIALGMVFMVLLNFLIGVMAFIFQEVYIFLMIKSSLISFLTGVLVPLALLPDWIVGVMRFFPFYYITYLPTMLLLGRNTDEIAAGLITLGAWTLGLALVNSAVYQRLRTRYDGVGI